MRAPVIYPFEGFVEAGGLVSYGPNYYAAFRRTVFIDKILKGAKPADLPVEQPTQLDLVINKKAAEAIAAAVSGACRQGNRVTVQPHTAFAALHESAIGPKRT